MSVKGGLSQPNWRGPATTRNKKQETSGGNPFYDETIHVMSHIHRVYGNSGPIMQHKEHTIPRFVVYKIRFQPPSEVLAHGSTRFSTTAIIIPFLTPVLLPIPIGYVQRAAMYCT